MKKIIQIIAVSCVLLISLLFTGCFGKIELDEAFNEDELVEYSYNILNEVHVNGVEFIIDNYMRDDYKSNYPVEEISEDFETLRTGLGTFTDYTQTTVIGKESPDENKEPFAAVCVTTMYEKGELVFFMTYDVDMKLVGFYVKE